METVQDLITDNQINISWGNADFGEVSRRELIANSLLKCASGYSTGSTAKYILEDLGLVSKDWELSHKGQRYLFAAYSNGVSV